MELYLQVNYFIASRFIIETFGMKTYFRTSHYIYYHHICKNVPVIVKQPIATGELRKKEKVSSCQRGVATIQVH